MASSQKTFRASNGRYDNPPVSPSLGEQTGEQIPGRHTINYGNNAFLWGNGGSIENPMGFPGYNALYCGTYPVYRWMLQHPVLRLVRSIGTADIECSKWEYEGERPEDVALVAANMDVLRPSLMSDFFTRGRDFGWQGGEVIWEVRGDTTWLSRVKPLLVDCTDILRDEHGNATGLINYRPVGISENFGLMLNPNDIPENRDPMHEVRLACPFKAFRYVHDSEAGYLYGRSWLENVRMTAWRDWLDCAQQLQKLGAKITGIQLILTSPAGTFPGPIGADGKPTAISYRDTCKNIITELANGAPGAWMPSINLGLDAKGNVNLMKVMVELINKSMIGHELLDHGSTTPAIVGILERMKHDEELMFMGGGVPSRVGMEAKHGAKADAQEHTDTATKISEMNDLDFARQCQPLVDAILILNRGKARAGTVRIKPPSLVDKKTGYARAFMLAALNDPDIATEMMRTIDVDHELDFIGFQRTDHEFDADTVAKAKKDQAASRNTNKQPEPQGGRPPKES